MKLLKRTSVLQMNIQWKTPTQSFHHSETKKVSHCKTCGHIVQGHKRPKDESAKCPGSLCCSDGKKIQCTCSGHKALQSTADPQQKYERKDNGHITAYQLSVSQADLSDAG